MNFPIPCGHIQLLSKQRVKQRDPPCTHRAALHVSAVWSCLEWPFCAAASDGGHGVVCVSGFIILFSLGFSLNTAFCVFILPLLPFHLGAGGRMAVLIRCNKSALAEPSMLMLLKLFFQVGSIRF